LSIRKIVSFVCRRHNPEPLKGKGIHPVEVMCVGSIPAAIVLHAFEEGADAVLVLGCLEGKCQYRTGEKTGISQAETVGKLLRILGIGDERFAFISVAVDGADRAVDVFLEKLNHSQQGK